MTYCLLSPSPRQSVNPSSSSPLPKDWELDGPKHFLALYSSGQGSEMLFLPPSWGSQPQVL